MFDYEKLIRHKIWEGLWKFFAKRQYVASWDTDTPRRKKRQIPDIATWMEVYSTSGSRSARSMYSHERIASSSFWGRDGIVLDIIVSCWELVLGSCVVGK